MLLKGSFQWKLKVLVPFLSDQKIGGCLGDVFALGVGIGRDDGVIWEDSSMDEFIMREENFHEGGAGFTSVILKK